MFANTETGDALRDELVTLADVRRIQKGVEAETVRLDRDDGKSIFKWAERLRTKGHLLGFKSISCPVPADSGLASDTFTLMIQTTWQRKMFEAHRRTYFALMQCTILLCTRT